MIRIATPPTVDWYDVDFPSVIAARELSLPSRANVHGISADLTTPDWLDAVPTDRPAVIVADGLMAFLSKDEMVSLLNRLTSHFPGGRSPTTVTPGSPSGRPNARAAPSRLRISSNRPGSMILANPSTGTPN